jgi:hypothetical protein
MAKNWLLLAIFIRMIHDVFISTKGGQGEGFKGDACPHY